jgi:outer membrane immunogenic protein
MKKALLVGVSLAALGTAPAFAADLAARTYTKAPVMAPIYNWGGFYIGANAGGGWSHNCWDLNNVAGLGPIATLREGCHDATGAMVGGQIGYRWQVTNWVFGVEAQGDWANLKGSNNSAFPTSAIAVLAGLPAYTNQTKIDAIGLFTGQVGYAWNNVLWYVKGGAAVTHDKYKGITSALGRRSRNRHRGRFRAGLVGWRRIRPSLHGQQQPQLHGHPRCRWRFQPHRQHQAGRRHGHRPRELHLRRPGGCEVLIFRKANSFSMKRPALCRPFCLRAAICYGLCRHLLTAMRKALITCTRHWKLLAVLPMFAISPHLASDLG